MGNPADVPSQTTSSLTPHMIIKNENSYVQGYICSAQSPDVTPVFKKTRETAGLPRPIFTAQTGHIDYDHFSAALAPRAGDLDPRNSTFTEVTQNKHLTGPLAPSNNNRRHHDLVTQRSADVTATRDVELETPQPDLGEDVFDVLDHTTQQTMMVAHTCGPTPREYSSTLDQFWPVISGEYWLNYKKYASIYAATRSTAVPNFLATRERVPSDLNIETWKKYLTEHHDYGLLDLLTYGFPSNYSAIGPPTATYRNHKEKQDYSDHIKEYVDKERRLGALLGPFPVPPFSPWFQCSPMMTREKTNSPQRRIIVDMSHPKGRSVNSGIPRREYLGHPHTYTLPAVSDIGDRLCQLGSGAYLWSIDVSRAYRQLRTDPLSAALFGITHNGGFYVDTALPFGCRSSGAACVRVTQAICDFMRTEGFHVTVYVDDFIGVESTYERALEAYTRIIDLCKELGFHLATQKCISPTLEIIWLGFLISSPEMIISIPNKKLTDLLEECDRWLKKPSVSRRSLQSLTGKLVHISSCIKPARKFISRILHAISTSHPSAQAPIDPEMIKDIQWFRAYAAASNGVSLLPPKASPRYIIECDSCMSGAGAYSKHWYFAEQYSLEFRQDFPNIHALEAANLVEAVYTLAPPSLAGATICVNTDNQASAIALETGRCRDRYLAMCARELWLIAALRNYTIVIAHKPGKELILADALSRAHLSHQAAVVARDMCMKLGLRRKRVTHSLSRFEPGL